MLTSKKWQAFTNKKLISFVISGLFAVLELVNYILCLEVVYVAEVQIKILFARGGGDIGAAGVRRAVPRVKFKLEVARGAITHDQTWQPGCACRGVSVIAVFIHQPWIDSPFAGQVEITADVELCRI